MTIRFLRMVSGDILASPALERRNYRDRVIPTAGGLYIVITVLVIEAGRAVFGALGVGDHAGLSLARSEMLFAVFGFGFLGLVDDLAAVGSDRGFRGHLGALRQGRVTTGPAQAGRRRGDRDRARGHAGLQVGTQPPRRRAC